LPAPLDSQVAQRKRELAILEEGKTAEQTPAVKKASGEVRGEARAEASSEA